MLAIFILCVFAIFTIRSFVHHDEVMILPNKLTGRLGKLWDIAHQGMRENRFLRAEKALLTILKIDEKNAAAYNRLGILYAKQKEYKDAIDCFEIASSIETNASSLHNLGLIYYETENYDKASTAFEQALKLEDSMAARHIAYAKVQEKLGNDKLMFKELEKAVELEPNKESLSLLHKAYESRNHEEQAKIIEHKMKKMVVPDSKPKRIARPKRRVVI
ncbi:tetratricopeptide repeat protein [Candidatus Saccharibacteria bacterium]|nr:tetratricopeptide repeat protein [Candidatus Saccharibacteria bacterium]